jgi:hypothetical protein
MADYTATCYGVGDSRKGGWKTSSALVNEPTAYQKGKKAMRFVVAAGSEIAGGVIYVDKGTTIAAADTLTLTVTAG